MSIQNGTMDGGTSATQPSPAEVARLRDRLKQAEEQIAYEQECFATANEEIQRLERELATSIDGSEESQLGRLRLLYNGLRERFELLKRRPSTTTADLAPLHAQIETLTNERNTARDVLSILEQEILRHEAETGRLNTDLTTIRVELAKLEKQLRVRDAKIEELETHLSSRTNELKAVVATANQRRDANKTLAERNQQLVVDAQRLSGLEKQLREKLNTAQKAERLSAELASTLQGSLNARETQIQVLEAEARELKVHCAQLLDDSRAAEELLRSAAQDQSRLQAELATLRAQVMPITSLHEALEKGFAALVNSVADVRALTASVQAPPPSPAPTPPFQANEAATLQRALDALWAEGLPLRDTITELNDQLSELADVITPLESDVRLAKNAAKVELLRQLHAHMSTRKHLLDRRDAINTRLADIENRAEQLEHRLKAHRILADSFDETLLEPLPPFALPTQAVTPEPEPETAPSRTSPPAPRLTKGQIAARKAVETRRSRAAKPSEPPPGAEVVPEQPAEHPAQDARAFSSAPDFTHLEFAAKRFKVRITGLIAVSLYQALTPKLRLFPTIPELFEAAREAGIWHGEPIRREEELTDGKLLLHESELRCYLARYQHGERVSYMYSSPTKEPGWNLALRSTQVAKLNAILEQRLKR